MIPHEIVGVGRDWYTLLPTAAGGHYLILFGIIFLLLSYVTLSPFSNIRAFFEGRKSIKKKKDK